MPEALKAEQKGSKNGTSPTPDVVTWIACPLCEKEDIESWLTVADSRYKTPPGTSQHFYQPLLACKECNSSFTPASPFVIRSVAKAVV